MRDWFRRIFAGARAERDEDVSSKEPINDSHDRAEDRLPQGNPSRPDAGLLKLSERIDTMEKSIQQMSALTNRVNDLDGRLEELRGLLPNTPRAGRDAAGLPQRNYGDLAPATPPRASQPSPIMAPPRVARHSFEDLERVLCQALAEQTSTGIEVDSFLADFQAGASGTPIQVEYIGQRAAGRWQIAVFLMSSDSGLAVVSPGGLADAEVSTFFEVDYGRRIFACTQPARVTRNGNEFTVVRKGRVESS